MNVPEPDEQEEPIYSDQQDHVGDQDLRSYLDDEDEKPRGLVSKFLVGMVRAYQMVVSPWFAPRCRYFPSCSQYAVVAVSRHGVVRGTGMATWRVLRCNPWSLGGVDHVPGHPASTRTLIDSPPANSTRPHPDAGGPDQT